MLKPFCYKYIIIIICVFVFSSCRHSGNFTVKDFEPLKNYSQKINDSIYSLQADLSDAVLNGIEIPSIKQLPGGKFIISFKINNKGEKQRFFYKLYYQNESYKWPEGDSLDSENFYGSWEEAALEFKATLPFADEITVSDSFKILGNPRDEKLFYGTNSENYIITDSALAFFTKKIKSESDWYNSIKEKAVQNKISEDEQIYFECVWAINNRFENDTVYNNRWKRNPRMGNYKFMLVVCNGKGLSEIPEEIRAINKKTSSGQFKNPFTYFLKNKNLNSDNIKIITSGKLLSVSSGLNPGSGIYVDKFKINKTGLNNSYYNQNCGESEKLRHYAQFSQYFHHINKNWEFINVREIRDVVGENLTREHYKNLINEYGKNKNFIHTYSNITDCPCKTVHSDSASKSISIFNPGNSNGEYKKEHVGIISRIGFTYGKWCAKIKFPELISEDNVWNGITSAFWLIFQADAKWNMRRDCNGSVGYIPKHLPDTPESVKDSKIQVTYSEIDFEILKESQYWVQSAYDKNPNYPREDASANKDITICCTNWDMGCQQPKKFVIGAKTMDVEGKKYEFCRWNYFNKLITSKVAVPHKEIFKGDYYYFEIDWQPQRIIWRIGKNKNNLHEICRMDGTMTSIPNNQMVMVMSQEFHYQEWWPTAPFLQNFIPFPKNNLVGKLLEVEIH